MNWDDVLDRMRVSGFHPIEETYMEHYGKVLTAQRPEFYNRMFRCTYGVVKCDELVIELFLFPSEGHVYEFLEVIGEDPGWIVRDNVLLHFPDCDPAAIGKIVEAISTPIN